MAEQLTTSGGYIYRDENLKGWYRYCAGMLDGCKSDRCRRLMN
jgi:hypothetical protein